MTSGARMLGLAIGGALMLGGLALTASTGGGAALLIMGAVIVGGILLEPRYKRQTGPQRGQGWEPTGEKFIDEETGKPVEVWYDPLSGERRYESSGDRR